jgi:hypothetical protein
LFDRPFLANRLLAALGLFLLISCGIKFFEGGGIKFLSQPIGEIVLLTEFLVAIWVLSGQFRFGAGRVQKTRPIAHLEGNATLYDLRARIDASTTLSPSARRPETRSGDGK